MVDKYSVISFAIRYLSSSVAINTSKSRPTAESNPSSFSNGAHNFVNMHLLLLRWRNKLTLDTNYERMFHFFEHIFEFDLLHLP